MSDKTDAEKWRLLQAEVILAMYERETGRKAHTAEELEAFFKEHPEKLHKPGAAEISAYSFQKWCDLRRRAGTN